MTFDQILMQKKALLEEFQAYFQRIDFRESLAS